MYIAREVEATVNRMLSQGKVVLLTGARQVGKTTLLKHSFTDSYGYATMENPRDFALAKQDSVLFFQSHEAPLIIDEVQRVPELFSSIKWLVDESDAKGQIILTGSQTYHLMKGVSESLAGRIRIIEMPSLSLREIARIGEKPRAYVPSRVGMVPTFTGDIWRVIQRGSMPELQDEGIDWNAFYSSYISSYLERDVRDLIGVKDEARFYNFMVACAARTGQLLNLSDIADMIGADSKTVRSWLSVLQASNIVRIVEPFWPNIGKSLSKTPKIYFMDTGLACYLTRWDTSEQLRLGAFAGHAFETFVVSEVLKSYMNAGANLRDVWFYRDGKKREIDLVIQEGRVLHPVEVKARATVSGSDTKNFSCLDGIEGYEVGFGHVVCLSPEPYMVARDVQAIPVWGI